MKRRIRINYKRLALSLSLLFILLLFVVKLSKNILAKNHHGNDIISNKEVVVDADLHKEEEPNFNQEDSGVLQDKEYKIHQEEVLEDIEQNEENKPNVVDDDKVEKSYNYAEVFKGDLFVGDSITDSLSFYEFLDESNVIAEFGFTARKAIDRVDDIVEKNPTNIFIMLGMNDIIICQDSEKFVEDYSKLIQAIKDRLPDVNIYINSILPVDSKAKEKKSALTNENIDIFNEALVDLVENENIGYLNVATIMDEDMGLLEPDGIHVKYKFYKLWLDFIIENIK